MNVQLADQQTDLTRLAEVMHQLRPQHTILALTKMMREQMQDNYQIAYIEDEKQVLSVAGFVIGKKLAWGKHVYVDDLVTNECVRSKGAGKAMIEWLKQYALENNCQQLHLDSGVQRYLAHRFYLREGFIIASHHFSISPLN